MPAAASRCAAWSPFGFRTPCATIPRRPVRGCGKRSARAAAFPKRALFVLGREHVVLRTLELPTEDETELPDMVRFAMHRDLPLDPTDVVVDFVRTDLQDGVSHVLAAAVPGRVIEEIRAVARAAQIELTGVCVRSFGTATIARGTPAGLRGEPVLAVDLAEDGVELVVARGAALGYARGVEQHVSDDARALDALVTEVRRSWLSHRLSDRDDGAVRTGVLLGARALVERATAPIAEATELAIESFDEHPRIASDGHDVADAWPLAGLLLRVQEGEPLIDLANPRKAPDRAARTRQRALGVLGLVLVAGFAGWTIGNMSKTRELRAIEAKKEPATEAVASYHRFRRDQFRLEHLQAWEAAKPDWPAHLATIVERLPAVREAVFDGVSGSLSIDDADFDRNKKTFDVQAGLRLDVEGETATRESANALRAAFVADRLWEIRSTGADTDGGRRLPIPFAFRLETSQLAPPAVEREGDDASTDADPGVDETTGGAS